MQNIRMIKLKIGDGIVASPPVREAVATTNHDILRKQEVDEVKGLSRGNGTN